MTPESTDRPSASATGEPPPPLDYLSPLPPIASRAMTIGQRVVLAVFILFPILLILMFLLATMMGP